jgi:hypothetical protein
MGVIFVALGTPHADSPAAHLNCSFGADRSQTSASALRSVADIGERQLRSQSPCNAQTAGQLLAWCGDCFHKIGLIYGSQPAKITANRELIDEDGLRGA